MEFTRGQRPPMRDRADIVSILEKIDVETGERTVLREFDGVVIEAPNWLKNQNALVYNSRGRLFRFDLATGEAVPLDTGFCVSCNNDHVLSPSHDAIAVSHHSIEDWHSRIYTMPLGVGAPVLITPVGPSYLHGWSPDGATLSYCGARADGYHIYTIPAVGGEEKQLTTGDWLDDGPEYSPDGQTIWFNSTRSGLMQLWRMGPGGENPEQMTHDAGNSWFAHFSPDGRRVAYITYGKDDVHPAAHPPEKWVELRMMDANGGPYTTLARLFGGQGTMNVNAWAPNGRELAFVSYKLK